MELASERPIEAGSVDTSQWPLIITTNAGGETDTLLQNQLEQIAAIFRSKPEPYVNIIDASSGPPLSARQRRLVSDFGKEHETHSRLYCRGVAFVFDSALMRGVMTALFWARPAKVPNRVFATRSAACAWGEELLALDDPAPAGVPTSTAALVPADNDSFGAGPLPSLDDLTQELRELQAACLEQETPDMRAVGVLTTAHRAAERGNVAELTKLLSSHVVPLLALSDADTSPRLTEYLRSLA